MRASYSSIPVHELATFIRALLKRFALLGGLQILGAYCANNVLKNDEFWKQNWYEIYDNFGIILRLSEISGIATLVALLLASNNKHNMSKVVLSVLALSFSAQCLAADVYDIVVKRTASNLYEIQGGGLFIKTRHCEESANLGQAVLRIDAESGPVIGKITFENSGMCIVEKIVKEPPESAFSS